MEQSYLHRECPTCEQEVDPVNQKISAKRPAEDLTFETLRDYWRGFFKEKIFFTYFRCPTCNILYCRRFFDTDQLTALYGNMPDNTAGVARDTVRKTQEGYFRLLQKHTELRGQMLELGPDIGLFSEFCRREGSFEKFWMFEPNKAVHGELAGRLEGVSTTISGELFCFDEVPDRNVDLAVMIHVLDHLLDPKKLLKEIHKKLHPGAKLLIVTHDESSWLTSLVKRAWPAYCLQHPQLFSPKSMRAFLSEAGFQTLAIERTTNHFPITFLLRHLLWAVGLKKIWLPQLTWLQIPLKLGNICTIATPKASIS
jgi:SAM-dependent methyltransferase